LDHAAVPRVDCPEHGVKQVNVPWAEARSRFTLFFERFAIDVLLSTQNIKGAQVILRTGWEQIWNILSSAVDRGRLRHEDLPIVRLGIDEKSFAKGQSYLTLLYDLDRSTVEAISEGNDTEAANECFSSLSPRQIRSVKAIAMDMSPAYVKSAKSQIPLAEEKIVHDRFHVMKMVTEAVDEVRREEHRQLKRKNDNRIAGTKYLWLKNIENLSSKQHTHFEDVYTKQLKTGKAWSYKEMLRDLWYYDTAAEATKYFQEWYRSVIHTTLDPVKKVARTIKERLPNVVSYCTHGITNAVAEGVNSEIQAIKQRVGGYRNIENFKTAIFFYCGGLNLYPR
jgi:transposase